jgi:hypothetical protein
MERIMGKAQWVHTHGEQLLHIHDTLPDGRRYQKQSGFRTGMARLLTLEENNLWFLSGMIVLIAGLMIGWRMVSVQGGTRSNGPDILESRQSGAADSTAMVTLEDRINDLNERVEMLTDSITYLESKLIRARVITDSIIADGQKIASSSSREQTVIAEPEQFIENLSPPAAGHEPGDAGLAQPPRQLTRGVKAGLQDATLIAVRGTTVTTTRDRTAAVGERADSRKVVNTAELMDASGEDRISVAQGWHAGNAAKGGPWVINLISSPSKADADHFAATARSRNIQTEQQHVVVKGKKYWRVQITGFATADEARAYAGTASDKLGLRDVWITSR